MVSQSIYRFATAFASLFSLGICFWLTACAGENQDSLAEDGRIGKVTDVQGIVTLKPVNNQRWTPVRNNLLLKPGDWVRTDVRGANAVAMRLTKQANVVVGPASLVEVIKPTEVKLHEGELEITPPANGAVGLLGPNGQKVTVQAKQHYRLDKEKLILVAKEPLWLKGFKGSTTNESLGSLIANVDGRNVPLTVGYHKVSVDIRDQIARTVIEESFVNHTKATLEGVFYFPLPQDASISGFGMWIGNELVEADIVEKQRAREIYEEILRERRDPGLLEWTGGNIFKARVFPIFGNSEKRIKISYTQVLPLKGNRYRYSYGLQSEMLQQHPLRELGIDVKVNSVVPLKTVVSPTHTARIEQTAHSGHVEFTAQEYTPMRDFEVVIETEGRQSDVVVIPHRRGDDGYFMLQLTPPSANGGWEREVLADGETLRLLIVADTSASMDNGQRATQATLIATLLASLTAKDSFNLACTDVNCDWVFEKPQHADEKSIAAARQFLANRTSLGWTNLDKAMTSALSQCEPGTQVVYIGDGIVTAGDADAVAFGQRLRRLYEGKAGTFHAITVGNSFEPAALKAIASCGGGSMRRVSGEQGPQVVALELLHEITQPALRDLKVEFRGLKTARVYPSVLPNISAGAQQIVLGRYLPEGKDQEGEVIISGIQNGKSVKFSTKISLKDAEQGNSFIPRLWARMHLDQLLEQGTSESIKDEIITLSEEYQIITPYTSFLVLESDADRQRFKVKRQFRMRDGEKFFAEGRDNANYDLVQKQMKRAGDWRLGLRRSVMQELAGLGRNLQLMQQINSQQSMLGRPGGWGGAAPLSSAASTYAMDGALGDMDSDNVIIVGNTVTKDNVIRRQLQVYPGEPMAPPAGEMRDESDLMDRAEQMVQEKEAHAPDALTEEAYAVRADESLPAGDMPASAPISNLRVGRNFSPASSRGLFRPEPEGLMGYFNGEMGAISRQRWGDRRGYQAYWLQTLFPQVPPAPGKEKPIKSDWPVAAKGESQRILRTEKLAKLAGGLAITQQTETFDVRWNELTGRHSQSTWYAPTTWLTRSQGDGAQTTIQWCDGKERGLFGNAFQLGRIRPATAQDTAKPPFDLGDYSLTALERAYAGYKVDVIPHGQFNMELLLTHPSNPNYLTWIYIDGMRNVVTAIRQTDKQQKPTSVTKFEDFVQVAGCWWATKVEATDEQGRRVSLTTRTVKELSADELQTQIKRELAGRDLVQFLRSPAPSVTAAKQAVAAGKATFDDNMIVMLYFAASQQWAKVKDQLDAIEKSIAGKPGLRWLRAAVLHDSRRFEELKKQLLGEAETVAKAAAGDDLFLANHLLGLASQVAAAQEKLIVLDRMKGVYQRQPGHVQAMMTWQEYRINFLHEIGQSDLARRLLKQLAIEYPHSVNLQQRYAQETANAGDYTEAYAWLTRVIAPEAKWLPHEEDSLRQVYVGLLEGQGRYPEMVEYLAGWVKRDPANSSVYDQYLSALVRIDQVAKAQELIAQWLREGQVANDAPPAVAARLQAAVNQALGQGHNLYTYRIDERWLKPLADLVLYFADKETAPYALNTIMGHGHFNQSDEAQRVRKAIAERLVADIGKLPAERIQQFVSWISVNSPAVEAATWKRIAEGLQQRWVAETKLEIKHQLGTALVQVLSGHADATELLAFLHRQMREGPEQYRTAYINQLFDTLLRQPWAAEFEDEALALLDKLSDADEAPQRLAIEIMALHRLTDAMLAARYNAKMKTVEHPEKLTRTELQKKQEEFRKLARQELADRFAKELAKQPKELARWINAEKLYLEILIERNLKQVAAECWEVLGAKPVAQDSNPVSDDSDRIGILSHIESTLRDRYLTMAAYLATRKGADAELATRLLKYVDEGVAAETDGSQWKSLKMRLLIALDRPKDLETALRDWSRGGELANRWRVALAYLVAEQGRIGEGIKLFETVEAADELRPADYRTLADWYMVENRRDQYERATIAAYKTLGENQLNQLLYNKLAPWQRGDGHLPAELDKDVLLIFRALFEKSAYPQNYLYMVQQFYQNCRDFRLLEILADGVVGQTAVKVYPFLGGMGGVLGDVRDEATVDQIVEQIAKVRQHAKTNIDRRALDLLEALAKRRAAELKNQPGPHAQAALAALQRAFKGDWSDGERRLMADFLAGLGHISQQDLAAEQLRQLKSLYEQENGQGEKTSADALHIAVRYTMTLHYYGKTTEAIDILQLAVQKFQEGSGGALPVSANEALSALVSFHESQHHYAQAEQVLLEQLAHPVHQQQKLWLTQQRYQVCLNALRNNGSVAFGAGAALYKGLEQKVIADLDTGDHNHRQQLVNFICELYRAAREKKIPSVGGDLRAFALNKVPEVLKRQTNYYPQLVSQVGQVVHDLLSPRDALEFMLTQIEREPSWFRFNNWDGWSQHGYQLGQWREEAKQIGDVESRLLKIVLDELRRDLESRQQRNRILYHRHNNYYWAAHEADFVKVAEDVLAERGQSGEAVKYIADYFYHGLNRTGRAIEILFAAHQKKLLDEGGQMQLVEYLRQQKRYAETIALLLPLIETRPDNMTYRTHLMNAYFHTGKQAELLALLKDTDAYFHKDGRWQEHAMAALGHSCLENQLFAQSVGYYKEVIPLHERTQPRRGIGNGTLSMYYGHLAQAHAGLKQTPEAVEAASGAIIAWGPRHQNRGQAIESLKHVLRQASDLDGYVVYWDKKCAETGRDSPVIRKAVGQAYQEKQQFAKAITQLQLAAELQPNDAETQHALLACYDSQGDKEGAIRQVLQSLQLNRRDIKLYQELGKRFDAAKNGSEAERAYTSITEMLPTESESHTALAEIRQQQNRWAEAIPEWEHVARIRALEPTGLVKLATAQVHEKQWEQAKATVQKLHGKTWPTRFGDVENQVRNLENQIAGRRSQ